MTLTLTKEEAIKMLEKIGAKIETGGKHHIMARLVVDGRLIFLIPISNGSKDIPAGTTQKIFRELGLIRRDHCEKLRNGSMDREEYLGILRDRGIIHDTK